MKRKPIETPPPLLLNWQVLTAKPINVLPAAKITAASGTVR